MIYKFKRWMYLPYVTEVFINADTDKEAVETLTNLITSPFPLALPNLPACEAENSVSPFKIPKNVTDPVLNVPVVGVALLSLCPVKETD